MFPSSPRSREDYFNSRPSARGDQQFQQFKATFQGISIHAPPRGATLISSAITSANMIFQFTPLREGRPDAQSVQESADISIHAPPRGATQNKAKQKQTKAISIHAPPRGATYKLGRKSNEQAISIHAPPRGATKFSFKMLSTLLFQFTPLREGRQGLITENNGQAIISIHAPPRGATKQSN